MLKKIDDNYYEHLYDRYYILSNTKIFNKAWIIYHLITLLEYTCPVQLIILMLNNSQALRDKKQSFSISLKTVKFFAFYHQLSQLKTWYFYHQRSDTFYMCSVIERVRTMCCQCHTPAPPPAKSRLQIY